jgi:hypothetical protein
MSSGNASLEFARFCTTTKLPFLTKATLDAALLDATCSALENMILVKW